MLLQEIFLEKSLSHNIYDPNKHFFFLKNLKMKCFYFKVLWAIVNMTYVPHTHLHMPVRMVVYMSSCSCQHYILHVWSPAMSQESMCFLATICTMIHFYMKTSNVHVCVLYICVLRRRLKKKAIFKHTHSTPIFCYKLLLASFCQHQTTKLCQEEFWHG